MESYVVEWLNLVLRWAHMITGIAWIGASFYFVWLDNHLEPPKNQADSARGVGGEVWSVHGGGFYHAQKYRVAPPALPATLHWFKYEAYATFGTGFLLLSLIYYWNAGLYLIDPQVMALAPWQAVTIGLGSLVAGWVVYDLLCRSPLGDDEIVLGAILAVLLAGAAWGLCQVFSGRGAYIHFGALIGTIMVANVFFVIIPGQGELVKAKREGREPDPFPGWQGKQRSVHNTYLTLPVLFTMISNHYALTYGHRYNWLVLVALSVGGALIRLWFVLRHKGNANPLPLAAGLVVLGLTAVALVPRGGDGETVDRATLADAQRVVEARCLACHAARPTFDNVAQPPKGVMFDTPEQIAAQAQKIHQQTVATAVMPPGNVTEMTPRERAVLAAWLRSLK